jgi:hypothetical protein
LPVLLPPAYRAYTGRVQRSWRNRGELPLQTAGGALLSVCMNVNMSSTERPPWPVTDLFGPALEITAIHAGNGDAVDHRTKG